MDADYRSVVWKKSSHLYLKKRKSRFLQRHFVLIKAQVEGTLTTSW